MFRIALLLMWLASSPALAENRLNGADIRALLANSSLYGEQHGAPVEQIFQASGQTFYLVNGNSSAGSWEVRGDQYCSLWPPNPTWSCYDVTKDGGSVTFIDKSGKPFPMRTTR